MARDRGPDDTGGDEPEPDESRDQSGGREDAGDDAGADVGGTDWLLQQLSGGRDSHRADAPSNAEANRGGGAADESDGGSPAESDAAPPTTASPKLRWSWETGTVEPIGPGDATPEQPSDATVDAPTGAAAERPTDLPPPEPTESATFTWALTPTDDVDPLVAPPPAPPPTPTPPPAPPNVPPPAPVDGPLGDDGDDYFHPALPIPSVEPEAPAETTQVPIAGPPEIAGPPASLETTQTPIVQDGSQDETRTLAMPADPTAPLAVALESQRAESRSARRRAEGTGSTSIPAAASSSGRGGSSNKRTTRILFWVAGGLLVVLILIGLYVFGTQIPGLVSAAPTPTPTASKTPTPTPTPTPTAQATGPQPPGVHAWDTLRGGECLNPFSSPWALTFTVVDCATPHAAQLVYTNVFSSDPAAAFPGDAQLASQINLLCTKPGIVNLEAAASFTDAQIQAAYPATEKQWKDGQRSYFCFVNRAGGEPLTGSIAGPGPTA